MIARYLILVPLLFSQPAQAAAPVDLNVNDLGVVVLTSGIAGEAEHHAEIIKQSHIPSIPTGKEQRNPQLKRRTIWYKADHRYGDIYGNRVSRPHRRPRQCRQAAKHRPIAQHWTCRRDSL